MTTAEMRFDAPKTGANNRKADNSTASVTRPLKKTTMSNAVIGNW